MKVRVYELLGFWAWVCPCCDISGTRYRWAKAYAAADHHARTCHR